MDLHCLSIHLFDRLHLHREVAPFHFLETHTHTYIHIQLERTFVRWLLRVFEFAVARGWWWCDLTASPPIPLTTNLRGKVYFSSLKPFVLLPHPLPTATVVYSTHRETEEWFLLLSAFLT